MLDESDRIQFWFERVSRTDVPYHPTAHSPIPDNDQIMDLFPYFESVFYHKIVLKIVRKAHKFEDAPHWYHHSPP